MLKKLISILMAAAVLLSLPVLRAVSAQTADSNLPVVFIGGRGTTLLDKDGNRIYPMSVDIAAAVKKVIPSLTRGNLTNDYTEFCDVLYETIAEEFKDLPLDCNGDATNGSGTDFKWTKTGLSWSVKTDEPYGIYDYVFYYDWRLDTCEIADTFAAYIDDVLEVTGAPKVKVIGRCMGGNIVLSYLDKYGSDKIDRCLLYVTTINGVAGCGAAFAGDFYVDTDAAARFAVDLGMDPVFSLNGDALLNEVVGSAVKVLSETGGTDLAVAAVKNVYDKVETNVVPRLLLATFATYPSYWSMVGEDYYESAKACAFAGREEEYAGLIKKIDNYHYNIQVNAAEILKKLDSEGMSVSVVCKYGAQQVPISKEYNMLSDNTVELYRASFGATCTDLDKTFDDSYLRAARLRGTDKYISPDLQVDCSTCLFPDNTWVIKNCTHSDFGQCIDELMMAVMRYPGKMSIYDNPAYPQYMLYDKEANTLTGLSETNCNTPERWEQSLPQALLALFKSVFKLIARSIGTPAEG